MNLIFGIKDSVIGYALLSFILLFSSCASSQENEELPIINSTRIINFSGYEWIVRTTDDGKQGPGPNYFSDSEDNVWVDAQGRLHLKVVERDGNWYCSGVILRQSFGFKKYVFYVGSRVDNLDDNIVGGLFTHITDDEEIDIEFSRWSDSENQNSQFAVQPSFKAGNKKRYDMDLETNKSTHFFDWKPERIEFASYQGHTLTPETDAIINTWKYAGESTPPHTNERVKINLWLFRGASPTNGTGGEMIIDRFEMY